jgi:hypothetical protein
MKLPERVVALDAVLQTEAAALSAGPPYPREAARTLALAEIVGSVRFAGLRLRPSEIASLVDAGLTPAGRSLEACNAAADYAAAAAHVAAIARTRTRRQLLRLEEIVALHALATRRTSSAQAGTWRTATAAALPSGAVPPPAWLVPRDMAAFVDRFASGPQTTPLGLWLADYYARFSRVHPFANANGRVTRLSLNLILARLRYPPLVLRSGDAANFKAALDRAAARDLWPSALFFVSNILESVRALESARGGASATLVPLAELAAPHERAALYKAAQRGRLRSVRRGSGVFTSKTWVDEYRGSRAAAGRRPLSGRPD